MMRPQRAFARPMDRTGGRPPATPADACRDPEVGGLFRTGDATAAAVAARAEAERRLAERGREAGLGRLSSSPACEIRPSSGGLAATTDTLRAFAERPEAVREGAALIERGLRHLRDGRRSADGGASPSRSPAG